MLHSSLHRPAWLKCEIRGNGAAACEVERHESVRLRWTSRGEPMFSDNETALDLLGFEDQVAELCALVADPTMLPVTIGLLGDWGSGKSSLLRMAEVKLREQGAVVVPFSPWRIESYDDAKSALLDVVVEHAAEHLPALADTGILDSAKGQLRRLRKRVHWLRAAGLAAKHIITLTAPSLDELDGLLRDDDEKEPAPGTARIAQDFHREFEELIAQLGRPLVVLIDDLDRCLPEKVLDILQAVRLFLSVKGAAFVLATDERVVRDAVRLRYPQASEASETDLPQEYLEKIVQIPLRIPHLGPAEVETYLNLLVAEKHLDEESLASIRTKASELRASGVLSAVCMNVGIARECLPGGLPPNAERDFELIGRISRLLAAGLKGNPRQVKRFLNALEMRRARVVRRGLQVVIDDAVLAKLCVLEYSQPRHFRALYEWQAASDGRPPQIDAAEAAARGSGSSRHSASDRPGANANTDASISDWIEHRWLRLWLALDPPLSGIDLGPYFVLARDSLHGTVLQARRLPQHLQFLLDRLASAAQRELAVKSSRGLDPEELSLVVEAGIERLPQEAEPMDLALGLLDAVENDSPKIRAILAAVAQLPYGRVPQQAPTQLVNRLKRSAPAELQGLLDGWETQGSEAKLSRAARSARKLLTGGTDGNRQD